MPVWRHVFEGQKPREVYHKTMKSIVRFKVYSKVGVQKVRIHNNLRARIALLCVVSGLSRQSELGLYIVIKKRLDIALR